MHHHHSVRGKGHSNVPMASDPEQLAPPSLQELSSPLVGPDDIPVDIDDLASHFLMEATQSSFPPPVANDTNDPLFDLDTPLEAAVSELYFDDLSDRRAQRGFERMWQEIIDRELSARKLAAE